MTPTSGEGAQIGMIAGSGRLPILVADGIRATGRRVVCVGLRDQFDPELPAHCDAFRRAGTLQIGKWIRILRRAGIDETVMVGRVGKAQMYEPLKLLRQLPDWRALLLYYRRLRFDRRSHVLLAALADELGTAGVRLIDSTTYIPSHLATSGVMGRVQLSTAQRRDVDFAWPVLRSIANLGVGQGITVRDCDVIAVEAMEGTDAMIDRTTHLCKAGGWTLLKTAHDSHDMRADVPTVGVATIERLAKSGGRVLALGAGRVIMLEKPSMIEAADRLGIVLLGL
ncbi:MAG: LpxI family protein [Phycisphaerales bacterium]|nr:LpxI family protein [Phycisphaerales bacterium]